MVVLGIETSARLAGGATAQAAAGPYRSQVATSLGGGQSALTAMVYAAERASRTVVVRRLRIDHEDPKLVRVFLTWEQALPRAVRLNDGCYGAASGLVFLPCDGGGLQARELHSGALRWELPRTTPVRWIHGAPDGELLAVFEDESWLRLDPASGARVGSGRLSHAREQAGLLRGSRPLREPLAEPAKRLVLGDRVVQTTFGELEVTPLAAEQPRTAHTAVPPIGRFAAGAGWQIPSDAGLWASRDVLVVGLQRPGGAASGLGFFQLGSLDLRGVTELPETGLSELVALALFDGVLVVRCRSLFGAAAGAGEGATFLVDPGEGRLLARVRTDGMAEITGPAKAWNGRL